MLAEEKEELRVEDANSDGVVEILSSQASDGERDQTKSAILHHFRNYRNDQLPPSRMRSTIDTGQGLRETLNRDISSFKDQQGPVFISNDVPTDRVCELYSDYFSHANKTQMIPLNRVMASSFYHSRQFTQ